MGKPVLVVTTHHVKEVGERIDQNYDARRNPNEAPFSPQDLLTASDGADALFITPVDRLDSEFFKSVSPSVKVIAT
jgi:lactate dehydrogenase-like 2-hydroxyacid dehydrogenase